MATTSFLYHTLGLVGYKHLRTEFRQGKVWHHVELDRYHRRCRHCGARWQALELCGGFERQFIALPVGQRQQIVVLHGHRQRCRRCGECHREPIGFATGQSRHLKVFARYVVDLCEIAPIKQVAGLLGVGWDLVKEIFKSHLTRRLKRRKLSRLRYIAVDEFATRKGHRYMTVVMDLQSGAIVHAQQGKDAAALSGFLLKLKRSRAPVQAVAMDMSEAYLKAVREVLGARVEVVHDPYHIVALANMAIDETRREMARDLDGEGKQVLKGSRFLLLRGQEHLGEKARVQLDELLALNRPLSEVYLLKEQLRHFWAQPTREAGTTMLEHWIDQARACASTPFQKLADTLEGHRDGLLAYFQHPISTGPLEGMNNKIKVLKRQAYGFRDMEYFKLRLFFLHESTYAISG
jgi:transposase